MKGWNYRIVNSGGFLSVHEAYYDENGDVEAITENPVSPHGETIEELIDDYKLFKKAFGKPVINDE